MNMIIKMLFFNIFDADIQFVKKEIIWRRYITSKVLPITQKVKLINKKKFMVAVLNINNVIFVILIAALNIKDTNMAIYPSHAA